MRHLKLLAVGAVLVAGNAMAQDTTPGTDTPRWSLGAGVGLGQLVTVSDADDAVRFLSGGGLTPQASLEYRLHDGLALVMGASTRIVALEPEGGGEGDTATSVGVRFGLRGFTAGTGLTRLSFHGVVAFGYANEGNLGTFDDVDFVQAALLGGLGVDHALTPALTLRLATDVAGLSYTNISGEGAGGADLIGFHLGLAPSLELRLAF